MNLDDLWIGERVKIVQSQKIGNYLGKAKDGRARVKFNDKILLVKNSNLVIHKNQENPTVELFAEPKSKTSKIKSIGFKPEIDLHIEHLNPSLVNAIPQIILKHQMDRCKAFIQEAIERRYKILLIIHGRGTGQLKLEVDHLLSQYEEFNYSIVVNNGGASQVWLK